MNAFKLVSLLWLAVIVASCSSGAKETEVISITYDYGDGMGHIFIGSDIKDIDSVYQDDKFLKESIELYNGASKYIVRPEIIQYLSEYINSNCNPVMDRPNKTVTTFTISAYSRNEIQKCYYYEKDKIKNYFEGMIIWIRKSPYKEELKDVLLHLQLYVDNRK